MNDYLTKKECSEIIDELLSKAKNELEVLEISKYKKAIESFGDEVPKDDFLADIETLKSFCF